MVSSNGYEKFIVKVGTPIGVERNSSGVEIGCLF